MKTCRGIPACKAPGSGPPPTLHASPLCLGGNVFGWMADKETSFEILDAYAAAGGNFIDTSDSYMASAPGNIGGESETITGEIAEACPRPLSPRP